MAVPIRDGKILLNGGSVVLNENCCCSCADCPGVTCPSCPGTTPDRVSVLFGAIAGTPRCLYNTVSPFEVWNLVVNLTGVTLTLTQTASPCVYEAVVSPGLVQVTKCTGDGSGCVCTGGADIATSVTARITFGSGSTPSLAFIVVTPPFVPSGGVGTITCFGLEASSSVGADKCCDPSTVFLRASNGFEDRLVTLVGGSFTVTPC